MNYYVYSFPENVYPVNKSCNYLVLNLNLTETLSPKRLHASSQPLFINSTVKMK